MVSLTAAADGSHMSGAMIALMPTVEDAERLAIEGGEAADQLHLTLYYLGAGADFSEEARQAVIDAVTDVLPHYASGPVAGKAFGAAHWNGDSDEPSWVWSVGDAPETPRTLGMLHGAICMALEEGLAEAVEHPELPEQHTPWVPHVCAAYSDELDLIIPMEERLGPVTFDRVRVAFAGDYTDIPLGGSGITAAADGPLRRQPTELELASRVDFAQMDKAWREARDSTVEAWADIQAVQRAHIVAAVTDAAVADDLSRLDDFTVETGTGATLLIARMIAYAREAAEQQQAEAEAQGVTVPPWSLDDEALTAAAIRDRLRQIGRTAARVLGVGLVQSAARQAMRVWGSGSAQHVAEQVDDHLAALSGAAVEEQIGAAMTAAQNEGRMAVLAVAPPAEYTASEALDKNSCLAPEVLVTTRDGLVPAKDVTLDDQLLTHSGSWIEPSHIVVSHVEEELTRVHLADGRSLRLTWDHPVLVRTGDGFAWRNAGDLAVGDLVVDQSTLELDREIGGVDLVLGETPHDVSTVGEVGVLPSVDMRAQRVPVGAIGLNDEPIADKEVGDPGAYLDLGTVGVPQVFEVLSDTSLDAGLCIAGPVAEERAVAPAAGLGREDADSGAAVFAGDSDGRSTAGLGAIVPLGEPRMPECSTAPLAGGRFGARVFPAVDGAVGVASVVGDGDAELDVAVRADLRDAVLLGADLGADFRVGELALHRAVHSAGPLPPGDLPAAHLAERRRPVRVSSQPRRLDRAALAERAELDRDAARRTRLIHDLSLQVAEPKCLVIKGIEREQYAGDVYDFTIPGDETFWAEGVLVHNCKPCREVDGTRYTTLPDARTAYPTGGYVSCLGGSRCRGTLVTVWPQDSEQAAAGMILAASANTMPQTNEQGGTVPYSIVQDHPDCGADTPWAVVKEDDKELMGCHDSEAAALEQQAALLAEEGEEQPADNGDDTMDYAGKTAPWRGPLAIEGQVTGDGREFAENALTWAELPVPLRWNKEDSHGGEARTIAVNVGRIDKIWRDGSLIMGEGVLDLSDDDGRRVHGKIEGKFLRGVSIDADSIADADVEFVWPEDVNAGTGEGEEDDLFEMLFAQPEKMIFHGGRIRAATLVDIPAFAEAYIALLDEAGAVVAGGQAVGADVVRTLTVNEPAPVKPRTALVAAGEMWRPPAAWFSDPQLSLPTPITVTDDGRIYGHAAQWGSCHIGQDDVCVQPPHEDAHPYYRTGEVACADGSRVAVGQITVGTGHAPLHYGASPAAEHYDNTGAAVADVAVGNDAHGIWVAGSVRPNADPLKVYELQAAGQVSGDWRRIGGALRLVGLLAVNVPGFPVPKMRARVASGEPQALVAAGRPTVAWARSQVDVEREAMRIVMRMLSRRTHPGGR